MRRYLVLLSVVGLVAGCSESKPTPGPMPNLVVDAQTTTVDWGTKTLTVTEKNIGDAKAGAHRIGVEINLVDAANALKPQCQIVPEVAGLEAGSSWTVSIRLARYADEGGVITPGPYATVATPGPASSELPGFTCTTERGAVDPSVLAPGQVNLVVTADQKNEVEESNESDNVLDITQ